MRVKLCPGESDLAQGEPSHFELAVPEGYELTAATGATLVRASSVRACYSSKYRRRRATSF